MDMTIGPAVAGDSAAILSLVRAERLNPNDLRWSNFLVAKEGDAIVGAVQIRRHRDGSRELGSLVVVRDRRGAGVAGRLIDAALAREAGAVHMVTGKEHAAHFGRWGFVAVRAIDAPRSIRRNYCLGQAIGGAHAILTGRRVNRLVILERVGGVRA